MPLSWLPAHLQTQPSREGKECTWLAQRHTEWSGNSVEMVAADPDTDHPGAVRRSDVKRRIADHDSLLRVNLLAPAPPASISVPSMSDTTRMRSDIAPPHPESPRGVAPNTPGDRCGQNPTGSRRSQGIDPGAERINVGCLPTVTGLSMGR